MKKLKKIPDLPEGGDNSPTLADIQSMMSPEMMAFVSQMASNPHEQIDEHDLREIKAGRLTP